MNISDLVYKCLKSASTHSVNCSILDLLAHFGEVGANFPQQPSLQAHFAEIFHKKLSPKINVKT